MLLTRAVYTSVLLAVTLPPTTTAHPEIRPRLAVDAAVDHRHHSNTLPVVHQLSQITDQQCPAKLVETQTSLADAVARIDALDAELAESRRMVNRELTESSTCFDQNDVVIALAGFDCAAAAASGFCELYLCSTCQIGPGYCDLSCGYCAPPTAAPSPSKCGESSPSPTVSRLPTADPTMGFYGNCRDTNNGTGTYLGGGTLVDCASMTTTYCSFANADEDFTPADMCCVCGGGTVPTQLPTPTPTLTPTLTPAPTVTPVPTELDACPVDGKAVDVQKLQSNLPFSLGEDNEFGMAIAALGDVDGDGVNDFAVSSENYDGSTTGTVHVLFMEANGTVRSASHIDTSHGDLNLTFDDTACINEYSDCPSFGRALAPIGDIDEDGVGDLAVGAPYQDIGYLHGVPWPKGKWVVLLIVGIRHYDAPSRHLREIVLMIVRAITLSHNPWSTIRRTLHCDADLYGNGKSNSRDLR